MGYKVIICKHTAELYNVTINLNDPFKFKNIKLALQIILLNKLTAYIGGLFLHSGYGGNSASGSSLYMLIAT